MAINREKKEEILQHLVSKLKEAKSVVFARYSGIDVKSVNNLRTELRENEVDYKIAKKTLIKLAAKEAGIDEIPDEAIEGPIAVAFGKDEILAAKLLDKFSKEYKDMKLMGGIMEGKILNQAEILELAKIPSHEELMAKFVSCIRSPLYGFYAVLNSPLSGFAQVLRKYAENKN